MQNDVRDKQCVFLTPVRFHDIKAQIKRQKTLHMNFIELYEYDHSSRLQQFFLRLRKRLFK